jgi:hypothetical protein
VPTIYNHPSVSFGWLGHVSDVLCCSTQGSRGILLHASSSVQVRNLLRIDHDRKVEAKGCGLRTGNVVVSILTAGLQSMLVIIPS